MTLARPNFAYIVNKAFQFMSKPLESHWSVVKRTLRYLSGTAHHGLVLKPPEPMQKVSIRAYSDSDWASDPDHRRSTCGSFVYFLPNLISCSLKK